MAHYRQPPHAAKTIAGLLDEATRRLGDVGLRTPRLDAEVLLGDVLDRTRTQLMTWSDSPVDASHEVRFLALLERRLRREPVAYIVGRKSFYDMTLTVTPDVLIPRAETEILVAEAVRWLERRGPSRVLDLCTGSGAIALAVARHARHVVGGDISAGALAVAKHNAREAANVEWRQGDLFDVVAEGEWFDLLLANPPYVSEQEYDVLEPNVRDYEPRLALVADENGLGVLRRIIEGARRVLAPDGALGMEIGAAQGPAVAACLRNAGFKTVRVVPDLAGLDRVVWGQ